MSALTALALAVVLLIGVDVSPQASKSPQRPVRPRPSPTVPAAPVQPPPPIGSELDAALTRLPPLYAGDSIEAVYESLKTPAKDDFESAASYDARLAALRAGVTRTYSLWLDRELTRLYDAERQIVKISVSATNCSYVGMGLSCRYPSVILTTSTQLGEPYVASNAYGASRRVTVSERINYGLILRTSRMGFDFHIAMPPDRARALMNSLAVLVTVGPGVNGSGPLTLQGQTTTSPTISSPLDERTAYRYLALQIVRWRIVNRETGEVFLIIEGES